MDENVAWIGRRTRPRQGFVHGEGVVGGANWWRRHKHVRLCQQGCRIELQSFVVAGRKGSDLIIVWRLLAARLIADGDDMNRIVVLSE